LNTTIDDRASSSEASSEREGRAAPSVLAGFLRAKAWRLRAHILLLISLVDPRIPWSQQPESDDAPDVPPTLVASLGRGRLTPPHGAADTRGGVGTMIRGLRPAAPTSVALSGIVESLNVGAVMVLGSGSVEAAPFGVHAPDMMDVPNGEMNGGVALEDGDGVASPNVPIAPIALLVSTVVVFVAELVIPVAGHIVIAPREMPGIGPKFPRLS
jgi:hypothetical protein